MNNHPFNHSRKPNGTMGHDIMARQAAQVRAQASVVQNRADRYRAHQRQFSFIGYVGWVALFLLGILGISWLPLICWGFLYFFDFRKDHQTFDTERLQIEAVAINLHERADRIDPLI